MKDDVGAGEAATILGVSRTTIQDLMARGKLFPQPASPDGKHYFRRIDVEALRLERELHPSPRGARRRRGRPPGAGQ